MKKVILFLFISISLFAQGKNDGNNSTVVTLDENSTYTGNRSECWNYSSIVITVYSDSSSAANGLRVKFSNDGTNFDKQVYWSYSRLDSTTNFVTPVLGYYYKVTYINGADSQGTFRLKTYLSKDWVPLTTTTGKLSVDVSSSIGLDSVEVNVEENNVLTQRTNDTLHTANDLGRLRNTKLDSLEVNAEENNMLTQRAVDSIHVLGNLDRLRNTKLDSVEVNVEEGNMLSQRNVDSTKSGNDELRLIKGYTRGIEDTLHNISDLGRATGTKLDSVESNIEEGNGLTQENRELLTSANDSSKIARDELRLIKGYDRGTEDTLHTISDIQRLKKTLLDSVYANITELNGLIQVLRVNLENGSSYVRGCTDTVASTGMDTLSRKIITSVSNTLLTLFTKAYEGDLIVSDTLYVSTDAAFPATNTMVFIPSITSTLPKLNTTLNPNLYFKAEGETVRYYVRVWGR